MASKKYRVYARIAGSKYLGEVEADTPEEAEERAWELDSAHVSLCHVCSSEVEDPDVDQVFVEEIEDDA